MASAVTSGSTKVLLSSSSSSSTSSTTTATVENYSTKSSIVSTSVVNPSSPCGPDSTVISSSSSSSPSPDVDSSHSDYQQQPLQNNLKQQHIFINNTSVVALPKNKNITTDIRTNDNNCNSSLTGLNINRSNPNENNPAQKNSTKSSQQSSAAVYPTKNILANTDPGISGREEDEEEEEEEEEATKPNPSSPQFEEPLLLPSSQMMMEIQQQNPSVQICPWSTTTSSSLSSSSLSSTPSSSPSSSTAFCAHENHAKPLSDDHDNNLRDFSTATTTNLVRITTKNNTCSSQSSKPDDSNNITNANSHDTVTTTITTHTSSSSENNEISTTPTMSNECFATAVTVQENHLSNNSIMSNTSSTNILISSDSNPCPPDIAIKSNMLSSQQATNCTNLAAGTTEEGAHPHHDTVSSSNDSLETSTAESSNNTNNNNNNNSNTNMTSSNLTSTSTPTKPTMSGPKYKLIHEGDLQVCRLNHTRTIVSKIMNSKYLRRWENHHLVLGSNEIHSTSPTGFMSSSIPYSCIEDIHTVSRWDAGHKFCIRITVQEGSVLLQANSSYLRDQWLHSIKWKKHIHKYEKLLKTARRPEVVVKEIKNMIDVSLNTPIHDTSVYQFPLELVSELLQSTNSELSSKSSHENIIIALTPLLENNHPTQEICEFLIRNSELSSKSLHENIIIALTPLLENNHPTQEICEFLIRHCKKSPRSSIVIDLFTPVAQRILKHNTDFGKSPNMRRFVKEYILALNSQNDGFKVVQTFVRKMHGQSSTCPHPRVLPNLVAVCLASIYSCYEEKKKGLLNNSNISEEDWNKKILCYIRMFETMSQYDDWRYILGSLLQPIPFPDDAVGHSFFTSNMKTVIRIIASDDHCDTHQTILSIRENKEGWFHLYCPGNICCDDDGELWGVMLESLIHCCCRRKRFLQELSKSVNPVMLLALRGNEASMEALCAMLEMDVIDTNDLKMQMITTLQTTPTGKKMYTALCERQIALRELQQKGGPKKLSLPPQSTDADLVKMLSSGSFGNLESLSLAFTQVTSACANELIKLTTLRSLNLWSTQFGDAGLQLISEHLPRLQVLNLCETPVTDKGLICLATLKNLRKLNLNSTNLSALTFEGLKEKLPGLQECDVRYTEAW